MTTAVRRRLGETVLDGGLVLLMAAAVEGVVWSSNGPGTQMAGPRWLTASLPLLYAAPLWWRRSRPVASASLVMLGVSLQAVVSYDSAEGLANMLAFTVVPYSVSAHGTRRQGLAGLGVIAAAYVVYTVCDVHVRAGAESDRWAAGFFALMTLLAWLLGAWVATRREAAAAAARLREAQRLTDLAVAEERARLARELHDVVSHNLGAVVVQAAGARALGDGQAAAVDAALESIEEQGREALTEMRHLLGLLRAPDEVPGTRPAPRLADIDALVRRVPSGSARVSLTSDVDDAAVAPVVASTAFRIVQEALTNALRHAHATAIAVELSAAAGGLAIRVVNNGARPAGVEEQPGYGLVGMRERVSLLGGSLHTGVAPTGDFVVTATLPLDAR